MHPRDVLQEVLPLRNDRELEAARGNGGRVGRRLPVPPLRALEGPLRQLQERGLQLEPRPQLPGGRPLRPLDRQQSHEQLQDLLAPDLLPRGAGLRKRGHLHVCQQFGPATGLV